MPERKKKGAKRDLTVTKFCGAFKGVVVREGG